MRVKNWLIILSVVALASFAQAAEVRIGGQLTGLTGYGANGFAGEFGGYLSVQGSVGRGLQLRGVVEGGALSGLKSVPILRLDADVLRYNERFYYGGGLGSGAIFDFSDGGSGLPNIVLSPVALLNAHAVIGRDFGVYSVEGVVRAGAFLGLSVRASFPIR